MAFVPQRERGGAKTPPPHGEGEGAVCSPGLVSGLLLASTPPGALAAPSSCGCSRRPRPRVDAAPSSCHRWPVSPAGHPPTFSTSDKTSARFVIRKCLEMLLTYLLLGTHMIPPNSKFQAHLPFATCYVYTARYHRPVLSPLPSCRGKQIKAPVPLTLSQQRTTGGSS